MRILTFTICSCITIFCFGQSNLITEIRGHYNDVNKLITNCQRSNENSEACDLYKNEISINSDNQTWPGSGKYTKKIIFWYDYPPGICDECGENGINVLQKIEITVWVASMYKYTYEFLFKNGNLIFYYLKKNDEESTEYRYYYNKGILIRYIENDKTFNANEIKKINPDDRIKEAINLQKLFLSCNQ